MKATTTAIITAAGASSASAMAPFFNSTSTQPFRCPMPFGLFCAGPSMSQNLLMKCELGMPSPINCIEHTASQPPIEDYNARCYETSPMSGQAGCAKDTTVYPLDGNPFPLPAEADDPSLPETPSITASAGVQTMYPAPANLTALAKPTELPFPPPADLSSLPKASLPAYVTTVTIGTKTQFHTIYSNCGNGTMLFGTAPATSNSYAAWQTGSIPGALSASQFQSPPPPYPTTSAGPVPNTIPCDPSADATTVTESETSTVSYAYTLAPTETTAEPSWIHPTDYATVTATATSFIWASGEIAPASSSTTTITAATEYPSSTNSGFDSGDEETSSGKREVRAPSLWVLGVAVVLVGIWSC